MIYSEFLWDYLHKKGCKTVFIVTGGYSMYLHDCLVNNANFKTIVCHHEQGAIYAAIGYAKLNKDIPIVCVTSGCGLTNTITGIVDCWHDSVPLMIICGQSNFMETVNYNKQFKGRNFSGQDTNVEELTKSITKYSKQINNIEKGVYYLQKAFSKINEGRKGASVLCIPLDIQRSKNYDLKHEYISSICEKQISDFDVQKITDIINSAERPIIIAGNGIKLSKTQVEFNDFIKKYNIPVVTTFLGTGVLTSDTPLHIGGVGIMGKRAGNFAIQNSDLVICLGSRMPISVTGYQYNLFARNAKKMVIDIDKNEHLDKPYSVDYIFEYDLKSFFEINWNISSNYTSWVNKCIKWKFLWNHEMPIADGESIMNPYHVIHHFNDYLDDSNYNIITNGGNNFYIAWQTLNIKKNMNFLTSACQGDLGWELPASIGAYLCNKFNTICIVGDGSFQFNVQELETIRYHNLPILFLVINNKTYGAIQVTQKKFFNRYIGIDESSGLSIPSFKDISVTYGCDYINVEKYDELKNIFNHPNLFKKPIICEIVVCNQERYPKMSSFNMNDQIVSLPYEDMEPFLTKETLFEEMIVSLSDASLQRCQNENTFP